ncbi:MAG TPA: hypothetical protein VIG30_11115 [Ktedonobacterales bacterium]|jgi:hypothetical protein
MREQRFTQLDRLFARSPWRAARAGAHSTDSEHSAWRPRGRWWLRARLPRREWWLGAGAAMRSWQRLIRPSRRG